MTRPPDAELAMCRLERSHDPYSAALVAYVRELEAGKTKRLDGDRPVYETEPRSTDGDDEQRTHEEEMIFRLVMTAYLGEACKYCGGEFKTIDDLRDTVWVGPHERGRLAHEKCYRDANVSNPLNTPSSHEES